MALDIQVDYLQPIFHCNLCTILRSTDTDSVFRRLVQPKYGTYTDGIRKTFLKWVPITIRVRKFLKIRSTGTEYVRVKFEKYCTGTGTEC